MRVKEATRHRRGRGREKSDVSTGFFALGISLSDCRKTLEFGLLINIYTSVCGHCVTVTGFSGVVNDVGPREK